MISTTKNRSKDGTDERLTQQNDTISFSKRRVTIFLVTLVTFFVVLYRLSLDLHPSYVTRLYDGLFLLQVFLITVFLLFERAWKTTLWAAFGVWVVSPYVFCHLGGCYEDFFWLGLLLQVLYPAAITWTTVMVLHGLRIVLDDRHWWDGIVLGLSFVLMYEITPEHAGLLVLLMVPVPVITHLYYLRAYLKRQTKSTRARQHMTGMQ